MTLLGRQKATSLLLLAFMIVALVTPLASSPMSAGAPLDFSKPASTYSGSANVTCFTSPDSSWLVLQDLMQHTQNEMLIMVYAFTNWFFVQEIENALARNSSMEIMIIVSWKWASPSERNYTKAVFYNLSQHVAFENNLWLSYSDSVDLEFTHAKFMVYDRKTVIVESCNWAKSGVPPKNSTGNREWGVAIQQPDVVNYFIETFTNDWLIATPYVPDAGDFNNLSDNMVGGSYSAPFNNQSFTGSMDIQCVLSPDNDINAIKALMQSATTTLDVQQMYIKEDWGTGFPDQFLDEILAARSRGVTCRVILDVKSSGNQDVADLLIAAGVGVAWQDDDFWGLGDSWMHNKGVIVDGEKVLISSINWSNESVSQNRESGVIITHSGVVGFFANVFQYDWEHGEYLGGLEDVPPSAPVLNDPGDVSDLGTFIVSWSASSDPDGTVEYYILQMSTSATFSTIVDEWNTTGLSQFVSQFVDDTYYFRVKAVDNDSLSSLWSNVVDITVELLISIPAIPGFPWEAILAALILVLLPTLVLRRYQRTSKKPK